MPKKFAPKFFGGKIGEKKGGTLASTPERRNYELEKGHRFRFCYGYSFVCVFKVVRRYFASYVFSAPPTCIVATAVVPLPIKGS